MPSIARKIVICAAVDGLVVQPLLTKGQRPAPPVRIRYGDATISQASRDEIPDVSQPSSSFHAYGVIGLITVSKLSYLITITRRRQVAQVYGHPVYVVTEVAITPCTSQKEAAAAIAQTAGQLHTSSVDTDAEDTDSDDTVSLNVPPDEVDDPAHESADTRSTGRASPKSSVAEDVISRKGSYGMFARKWFSKDGWTQGQKRNAGWSNTNVESPRASMDHRPEEVAAPSKVPMDEEDEARSEARTSSLLPKLLRTAQILYGSSRSFYFSYDHDLTRNLAKRNRSPPVDASLYRQVDPVFFWNRHTATPFIDSGYDALVLPLIQGFVGQREFVVDSSPPQKDGDSQDAMELSNMTGSTTLPEKPTAQDTNKDSPQLRPSEKKFLLTVISRRSTKRAGLRYLRRGIDEDGNVANAVETEQILSSAAWDNTSKIYSFLQIRGSIPLFFTQSPYSLKPAPVIQHSAQSNYEACRKHFERLTEEYGSLQIVNLVEKHGVESRVGNEYQNTVLKLNEEVFNGHHSEIPFEWFDFHAACRGMKFENVSLLLDILRDRLEQLGSTVEAEGEVFLRQQGVLRTNCMDCLDRTNVCQSSFAKYMLDYQLRTEGFDMAAQLDQENSWFNTLWADNGDAVSKQYASTAAMKGDYTRTKKRNYRGTLNDVGLSLTRFYNGMVNDYFSQAAIDFLLGNVTAMVFQEFEAEMMTKDPAVSMLKMREQAIELCQKRVVSDDKEEFTGGWVLLSPHASDSIKSNLPFEEVVLLLTDVALYLCRFNWNLDKVSSFERVDLAHVVGIKFGTYITSTMSSAQSDEGKNVGFVVSYQPGKNDFQRVNTRSLSSAFAKGAPETSEEQSDTDAGAGAVNKPAPAPTSGGIATLFSGKVRGPPPVKKVAFKAPYTQSSVAVTGDGPRLTEIQQVVSICAEVERLAIRSQPGKEKPGAHGLVEEGPIISLEEAKQNTTLLDQLSHSIKKLVWAT